MKWKLVLSGITSMMLIIPGILAVVGCAQPLNNGHTFVDHKPNIKGVQEEQVEENREMSEDSAPQTFQYSFTGQLSGLIQQITVPMITGYDNNLTAFGPRVTGTPACTNAGIYLYNEFKSMGLWAQYHNWSYYGYSGSNIVATLNGTDQSSTEIYIICAHYDTVSGSPGADDNAGGTAAVLAAADIMVHYQFNHTVRFIAFSGEEQGLLGSYKYAQQAYQQGDNIIAVLNADMIGYTETAGGFSKVNLYYNTASIWIKDFTTTVSQQYFSFINLQVIPSGSSSGSDQYSFWEYGYDAVFYSENEFNDYYHSPGDTIAHMNIPYAVKVTKLIFATLGELAEYLPDQTPYPPMVPEGPVKGIVNTTYLYTTTTSDPDGDQVYYMWDWGDGTMSDWLGPYLSGQQVSESHTWTTNGVYPIRVKAKDIYDIESNWSESLLVRMYLLGDVNGDDIVNFGDINPFVLALTTDEATYYTYYPDGFYYTADINQNTVVGFDDINPFIALLYDNGN